MTEGLDKEIDSLLRQAAQRQTAVSPQFAAHLDADEISLFAENALPAKARMRAAEHLADCTKCRTILANVVALNSEAASEIVHAEASPVASSASIIPWYRKLFMFPSLAYTMGGLVVLLAGMIGFVVLQNFREPQNSSIAQAEKMTERSRGTSGASSDGEAATVETYSANASNAAPSAAKPSSNTAATMNNTARSMPTANANGSVVPARPTIAATPQAVAPPPATMQVEDDKTKDTANNDTPGEPIAAAAPRQNNYSVARNQRAITPDSSNVQSRQIQELPLNGRQTSNLSVLKQTPPSAKMAESQATAGAARSAEDERTTKDESVKERKASEKSRSIGGKNFTLKDGVWYDAAYNQQKTVNLRRDSADYKKLDSGLRSIVDNLGGTVIVIWKDKSYRVQ